MHIIFFGSSLVSAYWNGAATYYRGIISRLHDRGHRVTFYEALRLLREMPEEECRKVAERARLRVVAGHTAARRAGQLQEYFDEARKSAARG